MTLLSLQAQGIVPFRTLDLDFGTRTNLITGDNGLGKSLILDLAFFQLTSSWPAKPVHPLAVPGALPAKITAEVVGESSGPIHRSVRYVQDSQRWSWERARPPMTALVIYARADGGFSIWDPARNYFRAPLEDADFPSEIPAPGSIESPRAYLMTQRDAWDGLQGDDGAILCNGLVRDWVSWQRENRPEFELLSAVLRRLSPDPTELLQPGEPIALNPDDDRDYPTLQSPYGPLPAVHASEAIRRIAALAYLLVWTWTRHQRAAKARGWKEPFRRMVILVDELEAHLHPKWQRTILPALQEVVRSLHNDARVQLIGVTHSPLLLASMEPLFDATQDRLFTIEPNHAKDSAEVRSIPFLRHGSADAWLVSDVFDLPSTLSIAAEDAIAHAEAWMDSENRSSDEREAIETRLKQVLAETDDFWLRWRHDIHAGHGAR